MTKESKQTRKTSDYNKIEQLDAIEHIRLRPGMYIGVNDTPAHLFSEVIDNALDEAANGYCDRIWITYNDNVVTVKDNGRGIPHTKTNKGQEAIIAATENMSGGKFNRENYSKSCGLHGVGLCAVRALSDFLNISSIREKEEYEARFDDAKLVAFNKTKSKESNGTFVEFKPCAKYFEVEEIPTSYIIERGRIASTEIKKLKIYYNNEELEPYSEEDLLGDSDIKFPIAQGKDKNTNEMSLHLGYTTVGLQTDESGSVNLLPVNAGTHIDIAKKAIVEAWNLTGYLDDFELKPEDVLIGSHIYVSASFVETAWTSQDKKQLKMRIKDFDELIKSLAKSVMRLIQQMDRNEREALLKKFVDFRENQNRLSTAKYMQGVVKYGDEGKTTKRSFSNDSKLVDCVSEDRENTELFVCLHRNTKIRLLDGTIHTIKELAENYSDKEFGVYSWDMDRKEVIEAIAYNPRVTGKTNIYSRLYIGSDFVDCTPDHKFVEHNSQRFVEARNIKVGDIISTLSGGLAITSVETIFLKDMEDVYCLTVKNKYHTFMLANGIITKNCEGNSAGSNLISQRDPMIHAVLPLRGKPKNIMEESVETILNNLEMRSIVNALGTGLMKHERPDLCRYGKIIIASDADCFTGDTKIYSIDGKEYNLKEAEAENITLKVLSYDKECKRPVYSIAKSIKSRLVSEVCELTLNTGEIIRCTPDHKVMLSDGTYKVAYELNRKDKLINVLNAFSDTYIVNSEIVRFNEPVQMYDLIVPGYRNFVLSSGICVHNCDGLQISSLVLAALCYLVPNTVLSGKVYLMTAPLYGIINQNIIKFETNEFDRYYSAEDKVIISGKEVSVKLVKIGDTIDFNGKEYLVKSISKFTKEEFIPVWESYLSPSIKLKRYKGLGSMSPEESKIALLSDKRRLQVITGDNIDKVMKLVGETEFKKILMKQNNIVDWQC